MNPFDALVDYANAEIERANVAEAKLARVRALADEWERREYGFPDGPEYASDLRAALDSEEQP